MSIQRTCPVCAAGDATLALEEMGNDFSKASALLKAHTGVVLTREGVPRMRMSFTHVCPDDCEFCGDNVGLCYCTAAVLKRRVAELEKEVAALREQRDELERKNTAWKAVVENSQSVDATSHAFIRGFNVAKNELLQSARSRFLYPTPIGSPGHQFVAKVGEWIQEMELCGPTKTS